MIAVMSLQGMYHVSTRPVWRFVRNAGTENTGQMTKELGRGNSGVAHAWEASLCRGAMQLEN